MSAGALTQLVAYGAQDVYLTGEPKFTYFKSMYRQHTNFAMETIKQIVDGSAVPGQTLTVTVGRHGDLVGETFIQLKPKSGLVRTSNNTNTDTCWIAERAFTSVELQINGQMVDKHYQTWWRIYSELFMDTGKKATYEKMISSPGVYSESSVVYLPLFFFFNKDPGQYLPLIALQMSEVKILLECSNDYSNYFESTPIIWSNYIFLDAQERNKFATNTLEYLIEQVQYNGGPTVDSGISETAQATSRINFNHPVKALTWVFNTPLSPTNRNALWNFTSNCSNVNVTCNPTIVFNSDGMVLPHDTGRVFVLGGQASSVLALDTEYMGTTRAPTVSTIISSGSLAGSGSTLTLSGTGLSNVRPGDVLVCASGAITNGPALTTFFFIKTINTTTGVVTLSTAWTPTMTNSPAATFSTMSAGPSVCDVFRVSNGSLTNLASATATVGTTQVTIGSIANISVGQLIILSKTAQGITAGTAYYVASIDYVNLRVTLATGWATDMSTATLVTVTAASLTSTQFTTWSYAPVIPVASSEMIESGPPHLGVEVGPLHKFQILLNGKFRFTEQYGKYFNQVQPFYHFKGLPYPGIYSYSFALKPCELSPSGTCNFSRIDIPQAQYWLKTMSTSSNALQFKMFAVNYNVFKIQSGLGGIMFSN
jgi:hypothetical protein